MLALSALSQLLGATTRATRHARALTEASVYAQQKMEMLLPLAAVDGTLSPSSADTIALNVDGYCDFLDRGGNPIGSGTTPPTGAAYVRRWTVAPIVGASAATVAVQVIAFDARRSGISAQLTTVVRQAPASE